MTPELEVLDQLQGGGLPLEVVAMLFEDRSRFVQALSKMLEAGDISLSDRSGQVVPLWRFQELERSAALAAPSGIRVFLTESGARRME